MYKDFFWFCYCSVITEQVWPFFQNIVYQYPLVSACMVQGKASYLVCRNDLGDGRILRELVYLSISLL